jgi:hypothetical protein
MDTITSAYNISATKYYYTLIKGSFAEKVVKAHRVVKNRGSHVS